MAKLTNTAGDYEVDGSGNNLISLDIFGTPTDSAIVNVSDLLTGVTFGTPTDSAVVNVSDALSGVYITSGTPTDSAVVNVSDALGGTVTSEMIFVDFTAGSPGMTPTAERPGATFTGGKPSIRFSVKEHNDG